MSTEQEPKLIRKRSISIRMIALLLIVSLFAVEITQYIVTAVSAGRDYMDVTRQAASESVSAGIRNISQGKYADALKSFADAVEFYGADAPADVLLRTASLYVVNGENDKAEVLLKQAVEKNEKMSSAWLMLAEISLDKEDYEDALAKAEECLKYEENARAFVICATTKSFLGDEEGAIEELEKALPFVDQAPEIRTILAQTYYERGELEKASEIFAKMIESNPDDKEAKYNRAICLLGIGQADEAKKMLEELEKDSYNLLAVKLALAELYMENEDTAEKGLEEYKDVIALMPRSDEMYSAITAMTCELCAGYEQYIECIDYANKNLASAEPNEGVRLYRAIAHIQLNEMERALFDLDRIIENNPNDYAYYLRGVARIGIEDYEGAGADLAACQSMVGESNPELVEKCEVLLKEISQVL